VWPGYVAEPGVSNPVASATLREFAEQAAEASATLNGEGFTEWGKHLRRDAELAEIAHHRLDGESGESTEMGDPAAFIAEANQADTNRPCIDYTELQWLEAVLKALETAHVDLALLGQHTPVLRDCQCEFTAQWRKARSVTNRVHAALGLRVRMEDLV
jgi:hypothetical protein